MTSDSQKENDAQLPPLARPAQLEPPPPPAGPVPVATPYVVDDTLRLLRPSVRIVWLVGGLVNAAILTVVGIGIDAWVYEKLHLPFGVLAGIGSLAFFVLALIHPSLRYKRYRYALRAADLVVEDGVWWRTRVCIPRPRIQHVDIDSGPVSRGLGLCQLSVFTAGATQAAAKIDGIAPETAEQLRAALLTERKNG
ncbi:MAG: PH domain-containing protein [Phycisphaerae bacterium]